MWDPANPDTTLATYQGHRGWVTSVIQLDDGRLTSASNDGTIQVWDPTDPNTTLATYTGHTIPITLSQHTDGPIISGGADGVRLWELAQP